MDHHDKVLVTPDMARKWFDNRARNRKFQKTVGQRYMKHMERDQWVPFASILFFNGEDRLVEGQHRVWAVWQSGKEQYFYVCRNAPPELTAVVDTGFKRNLSHELAIRGERNASDLAAALRWVWVYRHNPEALGKSDALRALGHPTHHELVEFMNTQEPDLRESVSRATSLRLKGYSGGLRATLLHLFRDATDWDTAVLFFELLKTGEDLTSRNPIYQLREQILMQRPHRKIGMRMQAALSIKAWNFWLQEESVRFLRWRAVGPAKEAFPEIMGA